MHCETMLFHITLNIYKMERIINELTEIKELLKSLQPKEKSKTDLRFERKHNNVDR